MKDSVKSPLPESNQRPTDYKSVQAASFGFSLLLNLRF